MEIRPILSALVRHKTGTILVVLQTAVSFAIIVNALFIVQDRLAKIDRPTGMDNHNIIAAQVRGASADYDARANITRDLAMLRGLPGVVDATVINQIPLSGSGSSTGIRTVPDENLPPTLTAIWSVDSHGINTLGTRLVRGRNFYPEEIHLSIPNRTQPFNPPVAIVTQALADKLFPNQDALGKVFYWDDTHQTTIIGILGHMQGAWPNWKALDSNVLLPDVTAKDTATYLVRTLPGQRDKLIPVIEKKLGEQNPHRVVRYVESHDEIIKRTYQLDQTMANILTVFIVLLIGLTALVIVGLASWFVNQRTRQIGTRRALGATRQDIVRYFLLENWLITCGGTLLGCLLTLGLSYWLETNFELPRLDWRYVVACIFVFWVVSLFSAWLPARRASRISPAIATRTV